MKRKKMWIFLMIIVLLFLHGGPGSANLAKLRQQVPELEQHVEKIYLMGLSWDTVIGMDLAARYPQDLYAYIAVSQVVSPREGEKLSLEFVREAARRAGDQKAIDDRSGVSLSL